MKKTIALILVISCLSLLFGCQKKDRADLKPDHYEGIDGSILIGGYMPKVSRCSILNLKTLKHIPVSLKNWPPKRVFILKEEFLYFVRSDKVAKDKYESRIYKYSLAEEKVIKELLIIDASISDISPNNDFQIIDENIIYYVNHYKEIVKYEISSRKKEIVYTTNELISSFYYFEDENVIFTEEWIQKDYPEKDLDLIYNIDLKTNKKTIIAHSEEIHYSEAFKKLLYRDKRDNKVKLYDVVSKQYIDTDLQFEWASLCLVGEDKIVYETSRDTAANRFGMVGYEDVELVLYDLKQKKKTTLFEVHQSGLSRMMIQFTQKDIVSMLSQSETKVKKE